MCASSCSCGAKRLAVFRPRVVTCPSAQSSSSAQRPGAARSTNRMSPRGATSPYPTIRPSSSMTRRFSWLRSGSRSQDATSRASSFRAPPYASANSAATCSASSSRSSLSRDEVIERLRQLEEIRQLAGRADAVDARLAEPVDPHTHAGRARSPARCRGRAKRATWTCPRAAHASLEELLPVTVGGL